RRLRKEQGDKEDVLSLADYMQSCSILATAAEQQLSPMQLDDEIGLYHGRDAEEMWNLEDPNFAVYLESLDQPTWSLSSDDQHLPLFLETFFTDDEPMLDNDTDNPLLMDMLAEAEREDVDALAAYLQFFEPVPSEVC